MRKTKNWKHTTKRAKQYKVSEVYGSFDPYFDPMSNIGRSKKETPFMDLSDIDDGEEDEA